MLKMEKKEFYVDAISIQTNPNGGYSWVEIELSERPHDPTAPAWQNESMIVSGKLSDMGRLAKGDLITNVQLRHKISGTKFKTTRVSLTSYDIVRKVDSGASQPSTPYAPTQSAPEQATLSATKDEEPTTARNPFDSDSNDNILII